jgi:hypothetical protein
VGCGFQSMIFTLCSGVVVLATKFVLSHFLQIKSDQVLGDYFGMEIASLRRFGILKNWSSSGARSMGW